MFKQSNIVKLELSKIIDSACQELGATGLDSYPLISPPPKADMGDFCFPTFSMAKELKMAPPQIAQALKEKIEKEELICEILPTGPYLNFKLSPEVVAVRYFNQFEKSLTQKLAIDEPKTMIEYSQPNTHKELHVGHMRNLCLGLALDKILRFSGVEIISNTFPGDVGAHVAKCLWYFKNKTKASDIPSTKKGAWLGTLYTASNNFMSELSEEELAPIKKEMTQILKELHAGEGEYFDLWRETRQWSKDLMEGVYQWAHAEFDRWYWESEVDASSVSLMHELYKEGKIVKDKGALGVDLSEEKLGFCLLLKSDGTGLYATKDVALANLKNAEYAPQRNLYVVDNRQSLHFKQVFAVLKRMGMPIGENSHHLAYEMVELPDGAMSSRKGNIVPLEELITKMQQKIKDDYLQKYNDWEQSEKDDVAHKIAEGAIKFGMNRIDMNKKIVFDLEEWLKLDGDSGPYIQYVYARIQSLLSKNNLEVAKEFKLVKDTEKKLLIKLTQYLDEVTVAAKEVKTTPVCHYLLELARQFNSFYSDCPINSCEDEVLKQTRLQLAHHTAETLKHGLALLGIRVPERM